MSEKAPGFEEYTPSRLEWLAVMLNSHIPFLSMSDIDLCFSPWTRGKKSQVARYSFQRKGYRNSEYLYRVYKKICFTFGKNLQMGLLGSKLQEEISSADDL